MSGISLFSDMVQSITDRGRRLLAAGARNEPVQAETTIETLCDMLLSSRGEASGMALAAEIHQRWAQLSGQYIIVFREDALAGYDGKVPGYARPAKLRKQEPPRCKGP